MSKASSGLGSSSIAFRAHAPIFLAEPYRYANAELGDRRDRVNARIGLAYSVLRYLVAILSAEFVGLGRERSPALPSGYLSLLRTLHTCGPGQWLAAARDLAKELAKEDPTSLVVAELPALLVPAGKTDTPDILEAFRALVDVRFGGQAYSYLISRLANSGVKPTHISYPGWPGYEI